MAKMAGIAMLLLTFGAVIILGDMWFSMFKTPPIHVQIGALMTLGAIAFMGVAGCIALWKIND